MLFDIVIPLGPNERMNIYKQIEYTKKNVVGYRNIYIVTNNTEKLEFNDCIIVDENSFPFKLNDIASYFYKHNGKTNRNGWYFQQLLKLYASFVIEGILDTYLVIDADVFFLKPLEFYKDSKYLFTISNENHKPYFDHMTKLHPSFIKQTMYSGIAHHMIFNKVIIKEMFDKVECHHNNRPFWLIFIEAVDEHKKHNRDVIESGASEYELYFNYMLIYHKDIIEIRNLNWANKPYNYNINNNNNNDLYYVSICSWIK
jgi:hypothetical protein